VAWVKAHRKGEGKAGNRAADEACSGVVPQQVWDQALGLSPSHTGLPEWVNRLNGDVRDEALWRLSEPFFRFGIGTCWIAPSLEYKVTGEDELEEEEVWVVRREVMTLREAQEEDAMMLKDDMAEKALEGKPFPRKQPGNRHMVRRAAPLKHIWRQTRSFPPKKKVLDFGAAYRKGLAMFAAKQ
jgi:hypothetical protein